MGALAPDAPSFQASNLALSTIDDVARHTTNKNITLASSLSRVNE